MAARQFRQVPDYGKEGVMRSASANLASTLEFRSVQESIAWAIPVKASTLA
jgi:hypothetical protein